MERPSRRLATIARYGSSGEFTKVASSRAKPSSSNGTFSAGASSQATCVGGGEERGVGGETSSIAEDIFEEQVSTSAGVVSGGAASGDTPCSPPSAAALRFPLSCFLFLRPRSVR
jgi:hypothetical protein